MHQGKNTCDLISGITLFWSCSSLVPVDIYFAGLARDCGKQVIDNLCALVELCSHLDGARCQIWVLENDSRDNTHQAISSAAGMSSLVRPIHLHSLDQAYPVREQRIAFGRDYLLSEIKRENCISAHSVYIPIDLDSAIACSINPIELMKACNEVIRGSCEAVFPVSSPFYYDIYALRVSGWSPDDCWQRVCDFGFQGHLGRLIATLTYVCRRQRSISRFTPNQLIPVKSAFGGFGVYRFASVLQLTYLCESLATRPSQCEHVLFNDKISKKAISTSLIVSAPCEHIGLRQASVSRIIALFIRAAYRDLLFVVNKCLSFFQL